MRMRVKGFYTDKRGRKRPITKRRSDFVRGIDRAPIFKSDLVRIVVGEHSGLIGKVLDIKCPGKLVLDTEKGRITVDRKMVKFFKSEDNKGWL